MLGTAGGWIERFNLQSGISRGSYLDMSERRSCAHDGEVIGVACDSTNTLMISAGYSGDIKVFISYSQDISFFHIGCNCELSFLAKAFMSSSKGLFVLA